MTAELKGIFSCVTAALVRRGRSEQDAEDLVQDAWIRLASHDAEDDIKQPGAFLMRTALNLSVDAHRMRQSRGEHVAIEEAVLIDTTPTAEAVLLARERVVRLSDCLARLTEKTRTIFLLHRVEGQTYQEIARQQGIAISTVERHVAKAMLQVTAWMEGW